MGRIIGFIYGVATYALMFLTFLYLFAYLAGVGVPRTVDNGIETPFALALVINVGLVLLFGLQHSVMARPGFKKWWTKIVPKPIERSTYVLISTLLVHFALLAVAADRHRDLERRSRVGAVRDLGSVYIFGIVLLFASTFVINHFDLFGLRQITLNLLEQAVHVFEVQGDVLLQVRPPPAVRRLVPDLLGHSVR